MRVSVDEPQVNQTVSGWVRVNKFVGLTQDGINASFAKLAGCFDLRARSALKRIGPFLDRADMLGSLLIAPQSPRRVHGFTYSHEVSPPEAGNGAGAEKKPWWTFW